MRELHDQLDLLLSQSGADPQIIQSIKQEAPFFPFSVEGNIMAYLLASHAISYEQYLTLYSEYKKRNQYLYLFDMAPRTFGETWGENHILSQFPGFLKATRDTTADLYPDFDGEFDLLYGSIRVEVKSCHANRSSRNNSSGSSLASRAYLHREAKAASFKYHYQQLKPSCCDVFIWIGVCRDELMYWVLSKTELLATQKLGPQHRNENTGIAGAAVFEGQVFMTE